MRGAQEAADVLKNAETRLDEAKEALKTAKAAADRTASECDAVLTKAISPIRKKPRHDLTPKSPFYELADEVHDVIASLLTSKQIMNVCEAMKGEKADIYRRRIRHLRLGRRTPHHGLVWVKEHKALKRLITSARVRDLTVDVDSVSTAVRALEENGGDVEVLRIDGRKGGGFQSAEIIYPLEMRRLQSLTSLEFVREDPTDAVFDCLSDATVCPSLESLVCTLRRHSDDAVTQCFSQRWGQGAPCAPLKQLAIVDIFTHGLATWVQYWTHLQVLDLTDVWNGHVAILAGAVQQKRLVGLRTLRVAGRNYYSGEPVFNNLLVALSEVTMPHLRSIELGDGSIRAFDAQHDVKALCTSLIGKLKLCGSLQVHSVFASALLDVGSCWKTLPPALSQGCEGVARAIRDKRLGGMSRQSLSHVSDDGLLQIRHALATSRAFAGHLEVIEIECEREAEVSVGVFARGLTACSNLRQARLRHDEWFEGEFELKMGSVVGGYTNISSVSMMRASVRQGQDLAEALKSFVGSAESVNVHCDGDGSIVTIGSVLARSQRLKELVWKCAKFGWKASSNGGFCNIQQLGLSVSYSTGCKTLDEMAQLRAAHKSVGSSVIDVNLKIREVGHIQGALSILVAFPNLQKLTIGGLRYGDAGAVWQALAYGTLESLQDLSIKCGVDTKEGKAAMLRVVKGQAPLSSSLKRFSVDVPDEVMEPLIKALSKTTLRLESLRLMSLGPKSLNALCAVLARSQTMSELRSLFYVFDGPGGCEAKL